MLKDETRMLLTFVCPIKISHLLCAKVKALLCHCLRGYYYYHLVSMVKDVVCIIVRRLPSANAWQFLCSFLSYYPTLSVTSEPSDTTNPNYISCAKCQFG